jgi:hypothetical protein
VQFPEVIGNPNAPTLLAQLAQTNVRVRRWRTLTDTSTSLTHWGSEDLWGPASAQAGPGPLSGSYCGTLPSTLWTIVVQPSGAQDVVELQMTPAYAAYLCLSAGAGDFKIEAWGWSSDSTRWDANISTQSW